MAWGGPSCREDGRDVPRGEDTVQWGTTIVIRYLAERAPKEAEIKGLDKPTPTVQGQSRDLSHPVPWTPVHTACPHREGSAEGGGRHGRLVRTQIL
jgi:hypothetical protein